MKKHLVELDLKNGGQYGHIFAHISLFHGSVLRATKQKCVDVNANKINIGNISTYAHK